MTLDQLYDAVRATEGKMLERGYRIASLYVDGQAITATDRNHFREAQDEYRALRRRIKIAEAEGGGEDEVERARRLVG